MPEKYGFLLASFLKLHIDHNEKTISTWANEKKFWEFRRSYLLLCPRLERRLPSEIMTQDQENFSQLWDNLLMEWEQLKDLNIKDNVPDIKETHEPTMSLNNKVKLEEITIFLFFNTQGDKGKYYTTYLSHINALFEQQILTAQQAKIMLNKANNLTLSYYQDTKCPTQTQIEDSTQKLCQQYFRTEQKKNNCTLTSLDKTHKIAEPCNLHNLALLPCTHIYHARPSNCAHVAAKNPELFSINLAQFFPVLHSCSIQDDSPPG